ncbi:MAG: hypothetical protein IKE53_01860 [Clostridiales bacterium]|nr:hypothetical protein [Clostridiales bacterium]
MGWKSYITGDVYSGKDFSYQGSELYMTGYARTVGQVLPAGWTTSMTGSEEGIDPISMPQWGDTILARMADEGEDTNIIYSENNITIDATNYETTIEPTVIYSSNGDITIIGNEITINGLIYAPNGKVTINANNATVNGRIVANEVLYNGSILTITASDTDLDFIYGGTNITPTPTPTVVPDGIVIELDTSFCVESETEGLLYVFDTIDSVHGNLWGYQDVTSFTYSISSAYQEDAVTGSIDVAEEWSSDDIGFFFGPTKIVFTATTADNQEITATYIFFCWTYTNADKLGIDIETDTDTDMLPDYLEGELHTYPDNEDSDDDGIPDGIEVYITRTDPLEPDSDGDDIIDGNEDDDEDGLSFVQEIDAGTLFFNWDSDGDYLSDGDEVNVYHTDPTLPDSDGDGISDYDEVMLGRNPDVPDATPIEQTVDYPIDCDDSPEVTGVSITMTTDQYLPSVVDATNIYEISVPCTEVVGRIGAPIEFNSTIEFDSATITFSYDESVLGDTDEEDLMIMWLDEENCRFVELDSIVDSTNNTVSVAVTHFSKYVLIDKVPWNGAWATPIDYSTSVSSDTERYDYIFAVEDSFFSGYYKTRMIDIISYFANHIRNGERVGTSLIKDSSFSDYGTLDSSASSAINKASSLINSHWSGTATQFATFAAGDVVEHFYNYNDQGRNIPIVILLTSNTSMRYANSYAENICEQYGARIFTICLGAPGGFYTIEDEGHLRLHGDLDSDLDQLMIDTNGYQLRGLEPEDYYAEFIHGLEVDSDTDGIPDIYETQGLRSYTGQIICSDPNNEDTNNDGVDDWYSLRLFAYDKQYPFFIDVFNQLPTYKDQHVVDSALLMHLLDQDNDGLYTNIPRTIVDSNGNTIEALPPDPDPNYRNAPVGLLEHHLNTIHDGSNLAHTTTNSVYQYTFNVLNLPNGGDLWNALVLFFTNPNSNGYPEWATNYGALFLTFEKDELEQAYHSTYYQIQMPFGYANLYDAVFRLGMHGNMAVTKSPYFYDSSNNKYILWAWRGNYANLGSGGEVGFYWIPNDPDFQETYERYANPILRQINATLSQNQEGWWAVAPYELKMELSIYNVDSTISDVINWFPYDNQWWITGFNPNQMGLDANNLWMVAKISFRNATSAMQNAGDLSALYNSLSTSILALDEDDSRTKYWITDDENKCVYVIWGQR